MYCIGFVRQTTFPYVLMLPWSQCYRAHECKQNSWDKVSDGCINGYAEATKCNLENVNIPHDAIICNDVNCTDDAHISAINVFYDNNINL